MTRKDAAGSRPLQKMFMAVPPSYDLLNRLLTLRLDEYWRKKTARLILSDQPEKVLDLCTGTGDLALHLRRQANPSTKVYALDYSEPMLQIARKKAKKSAHGIIEFNQGDAASMPYEDGFFDAVGIAFAFRNLTYKNPDTEKFLKEIRRVIRPGGRFVAVETSQPNSRLLRAMYYTYMRAVTVPIGGMLSGHRGAYHYLAHSAIHYHTANELKEILLAAGFPSVQYRLLFGGVAAIWDCRV